MQDYPTFSDFKVFRTMGYTKENIESYNAIYYPLLDKLDSGNYFPNIPGLKSKIKELDNRMNALCFGSAFAQSLDEIDKAEKVLNILKGQKRAYQDILKYVNK